MTWGLGALPDQSGRRWLITGATHGLGEATAAAVARAGGSLVLPARNVHRARTLAAAWGGGHEVIPLDLASLASVRAAAAAVTGDIDVLVNNAGTMTRARTETVDGFETTLAVNFLGPFALTNLLLPRVRGRVVIVSSDAHRSGRLHRADPHARARRWWFYGAYAQSKLADMLWGLALSRRVRERGVRVTLVHPGWVASNLYAALGGPRAERFVAAASAPVMLTPERASEYPLLAATADLPDLAYVGPAGPLGMAGPPALLGRSSVASDPRAAEWTWRFGVRETGTDAP